MICARFTTSSVPWADYVTTVMDSRGVVVYSNGMAQTTTATLDRSVIDAERQRLTAEADASHAEYPQYAGHWDWWVVVRVVKPIRHRGLLTPKGTFLLLDPDSITTAREDDAHTWSPSAYGKVFGTVWGLPPLVEGGKRNDTVVRMDCVEVLG